MLKWNRPGSCFKLNLAERGLFASKRGGAQLSKCFVNISMSMTHPMQPHFEKCYVLLISTFEHFWLNDIVERLKSEEFVSKFFQKKALRKL